MSDGIGINCNFVAVKSGKGLVVYAKGGSNFYYKKVRTRLHIWIFFCNFARFFVKCSKMGAEKRLAYRRE